MRYFMSYVSCRKLIRKLNKGNNSHLDDGCSILKSKNKDEVLAYNLLNLTFRRSWSSLVMRKKNNKKIQKNQEKK